MARVLVLVLVVGVVIDVFALIDLWGIDRSRIRVFNKPVWAVIIIALPVVGAILWFLVGRGGKGRGGRVVIAPDDDPEFLRRLSEEARRAERARRREQGEQERSDPDDEPTAR